MGGVKIEVVLPSHAESTLIKEIESGHFNAIARSVKEIHTETAKAGFEADEECIKEDIRKTVGYTCINAVVRSSLRDSISHVFGDYLESLESQDFATARPSYQTFSSWV